MKIVARNFIGKTHECATANLVCSTEVADVTVNIFKSADSGARGGVVMQITIDDPWFNPYVKQIENGCEIHIAGDCEASQLVTALSSALKMYKSG